MAIPDDIAADLDRAGFLARDPAVSARRRAAALADRVQRASRSNAAEVHAAVERELRELRSLIADSELAWKRRQRGRVGLALGTAVFAVLSTLLLDVFWSRNLVFPDIPVVRTEPGPPQRIAWTVTSLVPGSEGPEAGADLGTDPGRSADEGAEDVLDDAPTDRLGSTAASTEAPTLEPAPPSTNEDSDDADVAPPPGSAPDLPVAVDAPAARPRPGTSTLRRMVGEVMPDTDTETPPTDTAVADSTGDVADAKTPIVAAPQGGGGAPRAHPIGIGAALRRAGRPDLQVGVGPRVLALQKDAPIDFMAVGPSSVPAQDRARVFGLQVSRTEVTQKQWATVRHMDLSSISGQWSNPAEAMSWCEALRFANALSRREGLQPAYELALDCETGGQVRWDTKASGFRLLTETEWLALAQTMPGTRPGSWDPGTERVNNRGVYKVDVGVDSEPLKVRGLADNAREWVWGVDRRPDTEAHRDGGRWQVHSGQWPRSVARGCDAVDPDHDPDQARMQANIQHVTDLSCRSDPPPAAVPLGVGLRLARGLP